MRVLRLGPRLSYLKRISYENREEAGDDPLTRIHAGVIEDSCRLSLTSNEVPLELVKELAKPPSSEPTQVRGDNQGLC